MLASLKECRKERDDQGKTRGTEIEGNTKKNPRSKKKREIPGNPSVLNLLGME
jgi:hypothetical protein